MKWPEPTLAEATDLADCEISPGMNMTGASILSRTAVCQLKAGGSVEKELRNILWSTQSWAGW